MSTVKTLLARQLPVVNLPLFRDNVERLGALAKTLLQLQVFHPAALEAAATILPIVAERVPLNDTHLFKLRI